MIAQLETISVEQAAENLCYTTKHIYRLVERGDLSGFEIDGEFRILERSANRLEIRLSRERIENYNQRTRTHFDSPEYMELWDTIDELKAKISEEEAERPTDHPHGSIERQAVMAVRVDLGLPVLLPGDSSEAVSRALLY